jgi:hypothetical protein
VRIESSVTSVSWIPREAIEGMVKLPFELGVAHYDLPRPTGWRTSTACSRPAPSGSPTSCGPSSRSTPTGRITGHGHLGRGHMGHTRMRLAGIGLTFMGVSFPDLRGEPEVGDGQVRVHPDGRRPPGHAVAPAGPAAAVPPGQRAGGLVDPGPGASGPTARADFEVVGASSFPRHWIYGHDGTLQAKTGLIDFDTWYRESFGEKNPWGDEESPAVVTAVETELERQLSAIIIGSDPPFRRLTAGEALVTQGDAGDELFLLFDGVLAVEQDGEQVAEVGPGPSWARWLCWRAAAARPPCGP